MNLICSVLQFNSLTSDLVAVILLSLLYFFFTLSSQVAKNQKGQMLTTPKECFVIFVFIIIIIIWMLLLGWQCLHNCSFTYSICWFYVSSEHTHILKHSQKLHVCLMHYCTLLAVYPSCTSVCPRAQTRIQRRVTHWCTLTVMLSPWWL